MSMFDPDSWFETSKQTEHRRRQEKILESARAQERHLDRIANAVERHEYGTYGGYTGGFIGRSTPREPTKGLTLIVLAVLLAALAWLWMSLAKGWSYLISDTSGEPRELWGMSGSWLGLVSGLAVVATVTVAGFAFFAVVGAADGVKAGLSVVALLPTVYAAFWGISNFVDEESLTTPSAGNLWGYGAVGFSTGVLGLVLLFAAISHGRRAV